jgi:hypothetical protein
MYDNLQPNRNLPHSFQNRTTHHFTACRKKHTSGNLSVNQLAICCSHRFNLQRNPWILAILLMVFSFLPRIFVLVNEVKLSTDNLQIIVSTRTPLALRKLAHRHEIKYTRAYLSAGQSYITGSRARRKQECNDVTETVKYTNHWTVSWNPFLERLTEFTMKLEYPY